MISLEELRSEVESGAIDTVVFAFVRHAGTPDGQAAPLAAGLHGIENELELPPALEGNAYESDAERFSHSLREAIAALEEGSVGRQALGDEVVDRYLTTRARNSGSSTGSSRVTSASRCLSADDSEL